MARHDDKVFVDQAGPGELARAQCADRGGPRARAGVLRRARASVRQRISSRPQSGVGKVSKPARTSLPAAGPALAALQAGKTQTLHLLHPERPARPRIRRGRCPCRALSTEDRSPWPLVCTPMLLRRGLAPPVHPSFAMRFSQGQCNARSSCQQRRLSQE